MEGIRPGLSKNFHVFTSYPHSIIFCILLTISVLLSSIMISYIGLETMIDSYINPDEYMYISSDQFIVINEGNHQYSYSIIIQKQNHQDFSINNSTMICSKNANGFYLNSYALKSNEAQNKTEIIGKVISYIPSNHLTNSACVWWQKTNQIVQMLHELIKR